jgi:WD40 repeat protein
MRNPRQEIYKLQGANVFPLALLMAVLAPGVCASSHLIATEVTELRTKSFVEDMAFSPDGALLATRAPGEGVQIWDVAKRRLVISRPENGVTVGEHHLDFSRDGRWMVYCNIATLDVFSTANGHVTQTAVKPQNATFNCLGAGFSPDSSQLITMQRLDFIRSGSDLVSYDTTSWRVKSTIRVHPYIAGRKNFDGFDGCTEPPAPVDDRIFLDSRDARSFFQPAPELGGWSLSPDGRFLAISGDKGVLCKLKRAVAEPPFVDGRSYVAIIDLVDRKFVRVLEARTRSIDWSSNGLQLALGPASGEWNGEAAGPIRIVDRDSGETVVTEATNEDRVLLRYTSDGKYLVEAIGKKVEIWDASHTHLLQTIRAEPACIAVSGDGRYLALGGSPPSLIGSFPLLSIIVNPNGPPGKVIVYRLQ